MKRIYCFALFFGLLLHFSGFAQKSGYSEEEVSLNTYPFSNPNPVPELGRIYPYFRFDGYAAKGQMQNQKMVVLENDYIKLWITPEIGGKIWGAIEKSTGKEFIYFNHAVKFRDIAMRGPWTSGGLEFNFGVIGHAPSCSSPVDYLVRNNADGSVSCFVGTVDLPSATRWSVEINLPADKAYFTTRCVWDNSGMTEQSYYHWTNLGIKTAGNLEYAFPGNHYLGHDGKAFSWPVDQEGRDLHFYENNNFGSYKSYHVSGEVTNFYGGFWHNDNFGFGHYSPYDEKPGKKIWIWGLSDQGMIWEKLLTDTDGQYTELQSGRLFNQAASESTLSPFKHREFMPGSTDEWTEYWFPVKGTNGLNIATPAGSVSLNDNSVSFCPNEKFDGKLEVKDKSGVVYSKKLELKPLQAFEANFSYSGDQKNLAVWLNGDLIFEADPAKMETKRPVEMPADFDWNSVYGHFLQGKEWKRQRYYAKAESEYQQALAQNKWYVPALDGMAALFYRKMDYHNALKYAQDALSVDTYDADANMKYALASLALGDTISAIDGFSVASEQVSVRSAAYNGLATIFMRKKQYSKSLSYAEKSLMVNSLSEEASRTKVLALRKLGKSDDATKLLKEIELTDPLNHFIRLENWLKNPSPENEATLRKYMTNEFPAETILSYALWYLGKGDQSDALSVLNLAPETPVVLLWKAYLEHLSGNENLAATIREKALAASPELVFPYRPETLKPLEWAETSGENWKLNWYKGLILLNAGDETSGKDCLLACKNDPDFYPFYLTRSKLADVKSAAAADDVERALQLAGKEWRTGLFASKFYLERGDTARAAQLIKTYAEANPDNYYLGLHYAKMLEISKKYTACVKLLQHIQVLPNEGATDGRVVWRNANLGNALDLMKANKPKKALESIALARQWPENLGVGRPYEVDERMEDFISLQIYKKLNDKKSIQIMQQKLAAQSADQEKQVDISDFLTAWVLKNMGNVAEGDQIMNNLQAKLQDSDAVKWCAAIYQGNQEKAKQMATIIKPDDRIIDFLIRIFNEPGIR